MAWWDNLTALLGGPNNPEINKARLLAQDDYANQVASTEGQTPSMLSQVMLGMVPGMGVAGAMGYGPTYADKNDFIPSGFEKTGETLLGNVKQGNYGQALLQGVGVVPDVGYTAGLLKGVNPAMKAIDKATGVPSTSMERGMFAGVNAKTADTAALKVAEELEAAGTNADDIWKQTGWGRGADGKWRFEIDDSGVKYFGAQFGGDQNNLGRALKHDNLFGAYPDLQSVRVKGPPGTGGEYQPIKSGRNQDAISVGLHEDNQASTALHETQHAIQKREGFRGGGNAAQFSSGPMFDRVATDMTADFSKLMTGSVNGRPAEWMGALKYGDQNALSNIAKNYGFPSVDDAMKFISEQDEMRTPFGQYRRVAGEVEARNVQTRMDYTPEQRRAAPPWTTEDVARDKQIVRLLGGKSAASEPPGLLGAASVERGGVGGKLVLDEKQAAQAYKDYVVPEGWMVHGRHGQQTLRDDVVSQVTQNFDVADQYAGKNGSVWLMRPNKDTVTLDLSHQGNGISKIESAFKDSFKKGQFPEELDLPDNADEAWNIIKGDFQPEDIVNSAGAYDSPKIIEWLYDKTGADYIITPNGGVVLNHSALDKIKVPRN